MTFETFKAFAESARNDITVYRHGEYANDRNKVGVVFNGNSKVYSYSGSYSDVLNALGIEHTTSDIIWRLENRIASLEANNGKVNIFSKSIIDNSMEIEELRKRLDAESKKPCVG